MEDIIKHFLQYAAALLLAPLLTGIINRVKAFFAGRQGQSVFQLYFDLAKLLDKSVVYSLTSTSFFRLMPLVSLAATLTVAAIIPFGAQSGLISFDGDLILAAYLLALSRFFMILAALDTGSAFEGMGASREAQFAVFAEPVFFMSLITLSRITGGVSLSGIFSSLTPGMWLEATPVLALVAVSLFAVLLAENSRVPFDDPNTHLELTMIHEVMVLDNSGPDLAFVLYSASLKFWILGSLVAALVFPRHSGLFLADSALFVAAMALVAAATGVIESVMARFRLLKVPYALFTAFSLSLMALVFQMVKR